MWRKIGLVVIALAFSASLSAQDVSLIQPDMYGVPHLREAFVNAEARYKAGGPGVTEEEIVSFHNHLVKVLGTPDYTKLDKKQLRHSRMILSQMGALGNYTPKPGESQKEVSQTLSPVAAAILEDHLIWQKRFNAGYQIAPDQWDEKKKHEAFHQQTIDQIEQKHTGTDHVLDIQKSLQAKGSLSFAEAAELLYDLKRTFKISDLDAAKILAAVLEGK